MPQGILDSQRMYSQSGVPHPLWADVYSQATTPGVGVLTKNPSYITINRSGSYGFIYQHTGSIGSTIALGDIAYTTGSVVATTGAGLSYPIFIEVVCDCVSESPASATIASCAAFNTTVKSPVTGKSKCSLFILLVPSSQT